MVQLFSKMIFQSAFVHKKCIKFLLFTAAFLLWLYCNIIKKLRIL